jgi:hypothetical protein
MIRLFAFLLLAPVASTTLAASAPEPQIAYTDDSSEITVYVDLSDPVDVRFYSDLEAGDGFMIVVDGDRNGIWGVGLDGDATKGQITNDRRFQFTGSKLCAGYVLTASSENPDFVSRLSLCGEYKSLGHVEILDAPEPGRIRRVLAVPFEDIFGSETTAHVQACVWQAANWYCQHSPQQPLVLERPLPANS